jgi:hypothetical protein
MLPIGAKTLAEIVREAEKEAERQIRALTERVTVKRGEKEKHEYKRNGIRTICSRIPVV